MDQDTYELVHDGKKIIPYISKEKLQIEVKGVAEQISKDYLGKKPIFIGVLNGAFIFMADLIRNIDKNIKYEMDFIKMSSYEGQSTTGIVKALSGIKLDIKDRDIIIIEDIVETGITITSVIEQLKLLGPSSIKLAACFLKKGKQKIDIRIDYLVTEIDDYFIIGYGLDWNEYGRGLDSLFRVE